MHHEMKDEGSEPGSICRNHVVKMQGRILKRTTALGSNRQCHFENLRILNGLCFFTILGDGRLEKRRSF